MTTNLTPSRQRIGFLDGLRGLAALYVMLGHARWLLWEGFSEGFVTHPERYSLLGKIAAYASLSVYYGHQAVIFFFVLSGFVIHLRYSRAMLENKSTATFDLFPFLLRRLRRIYPLFIFAMLLTLVLDQIGINQHYPIYFHTTPYNLINLTLTPDFSLQTGLANLFLLPLSPAWGSNGPLWSLRYEWWFYVIYPAFWFITRYSLKIASVVVFLLFLFSLIGWLGPVSNPQTLVSAFPAWWLGALLADVYTGRLKLRFSRIAWLSVLFLVLPFLVAPLVEINGSVQDLLWAFGFTGLLAACLAWQNSGRSLAYLERLHFLGNISYSLYVIHFPILALISGWLMSQAPDHTLPQDFTWIVIGSAVCIAAAYLAHRFVERPFLKS